MSNNYYEIEKDTGTLTLTAFVGDEKNRNMLQITIGKNYITLTQEEQAELAFQILARTTKYISATNGYIITRQLKR